MLKEMRVLQIDSRHLALQDLLRAVRQPVVIAALAVVAFSFGPVQAAPVAVMCEQEDTVVQSRTEPLSLTYAGDPGGDLIVKSAHVALKLPAETSQRTGTVDGVDVTTTAIQGSGETTSVMPEPQALMDCAASAVQPEFKDDADMFALALMGCVSKTAPAASPLPVQASVTVGLVPTAGGGAPDVIVEIKRRYLNATLPSGGTLEIQTFPRDCKIAAP